jgi:lipid-A-disaccharide synthase
VKVLLLAGEPSGDRLAAGVARAIRELRPGAAIRAMGGAASRGAGAEIVVDSTPLAVMGLTEVVTHLPALMRARRALVRELRESPPDVLVAVDYPEFNLGLATVAREAGIPVAWIVSPQVWAWRPHRVTRYARAVSRMLVLFPFEVETWRRAGVPVSHVGHPLLDLMDDAPERGAARAALGLPPGGRVLALLPGSRRKEIAQHWDVMARTAAGLCATRPDLRVVVALAAGRDESALDLAPFASSGTKPLVVRAEAGSGAGLVLAACDVAAVASGTATLEAALVPRPLVACYQVGRLTMALGRRLADRGFLARGLYALPNLVLGREVVPELYQERLTQPALAAALAKLLDDERERARVTAELAELRPALGGPGACARAARSIVDLAEGTRARS